MLMLITQFMYCIAFAIIRYVFMTFSGLRTVWMRNKAMKYGDKYALAARVDRVVWRCRVPPFWSRASSFMTVHRCFVHPSRVLSPAVVFYCVTDSEVVFLELPPPCSEAPSQGEHAFARAVATIAIPFWALHQLADELGPVLNVLVTILSHSAGCGSTLMCQMVEKSCKRVLTFTEHDCIIELGRLQKTMKRPDLDRLISSLFRVCFHRVPDYSAYFIEYRATDLGIVEAVHRVFPQVNHIYLSRTNPLNTVKSIEKAFGKWFVYRSACLAHRWNVLPLLAYSIGYDIEAEAAGHAHILPKNGHGIAVIMWASTQLSYIEIQERIGAFHPVYYEDLLEKSKETLIRVLEMSDMEPDIDDDCIQSLLDEIIQKDNSPKEIKHRVATVAVDADMKKQVNDYCTALNLQNIW